MSSDDAEVVRAPDKGGSLAWEAKHWCLLDIFVGVLGLSAKARAVVLGAAVDREIPKSASSGESPQTDLRFFVFLS